MPVSDFSEDTAQKRRASFCAHGGSTTIVSTPEQNRDALFGALVSAGRDMKERVTRTEPPMRMTMRSRGETNVTAQLNDLATKTYANRKADAARRASGRE